MAVEYPDAYDIGVCNLLKEKFSAQKLYRPMRITCYEAGTRLTYEITGISQANTARIHLEIEKFVGGGFAGQVYRVKVLDIQTPNGPVPGIESGRVYALKILIPPSGFSRFFRNLMYRAGFQGPFQPQVNPFAARAGALWQKFIRRAAKIRFGNEATVNDIHATFIDETLGSCGEISDWIDGRHWRLEIDDRLDLLKLFYQERLPGFINPQKLGSPEYRAKKKFMKDFVQLLQDMGAYEFARQYEWTTCKSQPNCLKRHDTEDDPANGLVAVDFRAGLALLSFLPMSPGDIKLIFKGLARGSLVQFDRGNLVKLKHFIKKHEECFTDMLPMLDDLEKCEDIYRNSTPDFTHNHIRLLYSKKLWSTIMQSSRTGWRIKNKIDDKTAGKLNKSTIKTLLFGFLGAVPLLGNFIRDIWGRGDLRKHYSALLTKWSYIRRSGKARCAEKAYKWYREERINKHKVEKIAGSVPRFFMHLPLSLLPRSLHRCFTDKEYFKERLHGILVKPVQLYFSAPVREKWLRDMVARGQKKHMLNAKDAETILSQVKEPYIQKYLKSLAVHLCTLPATEIGSIILGGIYAMTHPGTTFTQAMAIMGGLMILFQFTPISPGSLVRGIYVVYLVIKERNYKDYNIAVYLAFFKYIGYLAFPIQMTYRYPELARFMAGHWATEAVHIVPVFGEKGALLEHWVFRLFYNWPLTLRRRMLKRAEYRAAQSPRYWHVPLIATAAAAILAAADHMFLQYIGIMPTLYDTWWLALLVIFIGSAVITLGCGGAPIGKRIISAVVWGVMTGFLYTIFTAYWVMEGNFMLNEILISGIWRVFIFTVFAPIGALITELRLPDPDLKKNSYQPLFEKV
ncbi:MAG: hypothetical protein MUF15_01695 [Acidobacteria bacterium]|jgi:hypothetical protein|nr:hypothetical protein [Acidobacteriota bacterium]